jgi:hypothetical protein
MPGCSFLISWKSMSRIASLRVLRGPLLRPHKRQVCSGLDNQCYSISNSITLRTFYFCEHFSKIAHIEITPKWPVAWETTGLFWLRFLPK